MTCVVSPGELFVAPRCCGPTGEPHAATHVKMTTDARARGTPHCATDLRNTEKPA
jgi:hypothetical protein